MESTNHILLKDKSGAPLEIAGCSSQDLPALMEMYEVFSPRPASQGLPPEDPETCHRWVEGLLAMGENLLARKGEKVIGHAALIPGVKGDSPEFVIFIHQDYRGFGIGTALTGYSLERAKGLGFSSVWLTVAIQNFIAIRLYRKLGFEYCDMDDCERTMRITFKG